MLNINETNEKCYFISYFENSRILVFLANLFLFRDYPNISEINLFFFYFKLNIFVKINEE